MTVSVKNKPPVVVPAAALRRAGFKSGEDLEFKASGRLITIVPKADRAESSAHQRQLDRGINESLKEFRQGKFAGPFATAQEFLADLHKGSAKLARASKKTKRARE